MINRYTFTLPKKEIATDITEGQLFFDLPTRQYSGFSNDVPAVLDEVAETF
jgi:hypothetical protein